MAGIACPVEANRRERVLSDDEIAKLWRAVEGDPFEGMVRLLILTGARRSEISQLRWTEILEDAIHLPAERTKTGQPRIVPLSPQAAAIIAGATRNGAYVFGGKKAWSAAKVRIDAATGINEPWVVHDIRRSVATKMQKLGISLQVVEAILGHVGTRAGIVGVYQVYDYLEEKQAALEAWGAHVARLT
jgi:integrase